MPTLAALIADVLDRAAECVNGPVLGSAAATATAGTVVVPRGQLGTLADGRVVRCTKATRVGTIGGSVPLRSLFLAPAYPAAGNFNATPIGTTVTWVDPPSGLAPTATVDATFAPAEGAPLVSLVEQEHLPANVDPFGAGAQGSALAVLLSPLVRPIAGSERMARYTRVEVTGSIRCNLSTLAGQGVRRVAAREIFDALSGALNGAKVAGDILSPTGWRLVQQTGVSTSYEFTWLVRTWMRGRVMQSAHAQSDGLTQPFETFAHETHVNANGQLPDELVAEDVAIPQP